MFSLQLVILALALVAWLPSRGEALNVTDKIFNGDNAKNEFEFTTWISQDDELICGGSLYRKRYVITAASCFGDYTPDDPDNCPKFHVILGDFNRNVDDGQQKIKICNVKIHPDYNPTTRENNVALVRLERDAALSRDNIKLVPKVQFEPYDIQLINTADCYLTGYGENDNGQIVRKRQKLSVNVQPDAACSNIDNYDDDNNLCYFTQSSQGGPCNRDDGSPISCIVNGKVTQFGIHSFEPDGCNPGKQVAMDTYKYRRFIKGMIDVLNSGGYECDKKDKVPRDKGCGPEGKAFMLGFIAPDPDSSLPFVYVCASASETANIELTALPAIQNLLVDDEYDIPAGTCIKIQLPKELHTREKGQQEFSIRIHSDVDIMVSIGYEPYAIGTTQVIPESCLKKNEYKYLISSIPRGYHNTAVIIALKDGTTVTLKLPNGDEIVVQLDTFETYIKKAHEISGIIVHGTGPLAVYAGVDCAYIPELSTNYCDTVFEMMPPIATFNKYFVVPRLKPRQNYVLRIFAQEDGTTIILRNADGTVNDQATINAQEVWQTALLTADVSVSADKPVLTSLFMTGGTTDIGEQGDPCEVLIPGVNEWSYVYYLYATATQGTHYVAIFIDADLDITGLTLNGNPITPDFNTEVVYIPGDKTYTIFYETLVQGFNVIKNAEKGNFGVIQYMLEFYRATCSAPRSLSISPPVVGGG